MDAFDADVLIYAAVPGHPLGRRVRALFPSGAAETDDAVGDVVLTGVGSVLLIPELLTKPMRERAFGELAALGALLGRIDLRATDLNTAELATALGATYQLRPADAVHLATALQAGANRFLTNNAKDFPKSISEIDVTYPMDLPDPDAAPGRRR